MWIAIIIVAVVLLVIVIEVIAISNRFKVMKVKITEADSGIDVALTNRYDSLTKLMDIVRSYAKHERDVLAEVIELRKGMALGEKEEADRQMDAAAARINVIAEAYPELRSSENYRNLQDAVMGAENQLQAARRVYNMNVSSFNQAIVQFPASIIANSQKLKQQPFFEADKQKTEDVKIEL